MFPIPEAARCNLRRAAQKCPEILGALTFERQQIGWLDAPRARVLLSAQLIRCTGEDFALVATTGLETALAQTGKLLCTLGLAPMPTGEALDVFAFNAETAEIHTTLGRADRSLFRALGLLTCVVHLTARNSEGFILGLRSSAKRIGPGRWDSLAAGMVRAGEAPETALAREAMEEAGIAPDVLATLHIRDLPPRIRLCTPKNEGVLFERTYPFTATLPPKIKLIPRPGEVERFATFSLQEVRELIVRSQIMHEAAAGVEAAVLLHKN